MPLSTAGKGCPEVTQKRSDWRDWPTAFAAGFLLAFPTQAHVQLLPSPGPQNPRLIPRTHEERERKYQELHRIVLSVQVSSPSGQPAESLQQSDFTLLVDHQPHRIAYFQSINLNSAENPARIVLVVDALNNSAGKVAVYRKEITRYLQSGTTVPLPNPTAIALLSEHGMDLGSFSTDRVIVLGQLDRLTGKVHSMSCRDTTPERVQESDQHDPNPRLDCLDRLFNSSITALNSLGESLALSRSKSHRPVRTIVIWMGRGWPLLNQPGYTPDTPETKASFYRDLVNISSALTEAEVSLSTVASSEILPISRKNLSKSYFFRGISDPKDANASSLSLQALAWQSGGTVLNASKDISAQIARCAKDAQAYYLLSFEYPPSPSFGQFHILSVTLDNASLNVRARTVYYAEQ